MEPLGIERIEERVREDSLEHISPHKANLALEIHAWLKLRPQLMLAQR